MFLWLKVTNDEYELPLVVADSAAELARRCNTTKNNIYSCYSKYMKGKRKHPKYIKVKIEKEN